MIFWIVGIIFNIVTFPGKIVNWFIQGLFNAMFSVPSTDLAVEKDVNLNQVEPTEEAMEDASRVLEDGEQPGEGERWEQFIDYNGVEKYSNLFGVVLGPFFVTTAVAGVLFLGMFSLQRAGIIGDAFWMWLAGFYPGFVVAAHAFPNQEPTMALWDQSRKTDSFLRIIGYPLAALSVLFDKLQFLWIDAIYAIALYWLVSLPFEGLP